MYTDKYGKKWFKGNLHTHTTVSDGMMSPLETLTLYEENGYDFIALTDHWKWSDKSYGSKMLVLSGAEYDFGKKSSEGIYHIVALGCMNEPKINRNDTAQMAIDAIHSVGGLANLAHPAWSLNSPEDLMKFTGVDMTEIFNSISDVPFNCRPYSGVILDIMASRGCMWKFAASDDTHFYKKSDSCRSFVYVNSNSCTRYDIMKSLSEGNYYSSQGPRMSVEIKGGKLFVETSPVEEVVFFTDRVYTPDRTVTGTDITQTVYEIKPDDNFVRVEIKDKDGNYAWSQYYKNKEMR